MGRVRDPRLHASIHLDPLDGTRAPAVAQLTQAVAETPYVVFRQTPTATRQQHEAQKRRRLGSPRHAGLARMQAQAAAFQVAVDTLPPHLQPAGIIVKQNLTSYDCHYIF